MNIRPIPPHYGTGFCSNERLPEMAARYREEQAGRLWNYHFTKDNYQWPVPLISSSPVIDGFSPNLNKKLHVGHLRNLAVANSLSRIFPNGRMVAMLGASQGVYKYAEADLHHWWNFLDYTPEVYYDVLMPRDDDIVPRRVAMMPDPIARDFDNKPFESECTVWDGPNGPVVVMRGDGSPTYAFHDLAFAATVKPTHYLTGAEQREHFVNLGLGDKHLPMGLVLGADNKKLKSRTGDALMAGDVIKMIEDRLDETPHLTELAWNILCWNFLRCARTSDVKFTPVEWCSPTHGGMYISYVHARFRSALQNAANLLQENTKPETDDDVKICGRSEYSIHYCNRAIETLDPAPLANFAFELATWLTEAYHKEKIVGGRKAWASSIARATDNLRWVMDHLGMFPLEKI